MTSIDIAPLVTGLGGGLALFLFGMSQMTESLKTVAGHSMKNLLSRLTANRFSAALAGAIVTAIVQSSSVTTVLLVGFISSGLLGLSQSIGVIVGANVGTTVTGQIIAFQVYKYGLIMIAIGFFTNVVAKRETLRQWATALMGLGLIFFGMELMSNATEPLQTWQPFIDAMQNLQYPFMAIAIGAVFTAIVQSSSATTGIVIVLASHGLISLETGIGLLLGANVGTCVTAVIAAIGRPREAVQAAWVHIIFNVGGVLLWMFFISPLADVVTAVSPVSVNRALVDRLAADTPRQIANAHTLFNVGNALLFIWFTGPMARFVNWLVPEKPISDTFQAKYLDAIYLEQPSLALDHVRLELVRMAERVASMLDAALSVAATGSRSSIQTLAKKDDEIDKLYGQIILYLGKISQRSLVDPQPKQIQEFVGVANYLENMGDVIDKNVLACAEKRLGRNLTISSSTLSVLRPISDKVVAAFEQALLSLKSVDREAAMEAVESKETVNRLADEAEVHLVQRLVVSEPNRLAAFQIETDIVESLKHLNTLTRRIARLVLIEEAPAVVEAPAEEDSPPAVEL